MKQLPKTSAQPNPAGRFAVAARTFAACLASGTLLAQDAPPVHTERPAPATAPARQHESRTPGAPLKEANGSLPGGEAKGGNDPTPRARAVESPAPAAMPGIPGVYPPAPRQPVLQEPTLGIPMAPAGVGPVPGLPEGDSSAREQPVGRQTPPAARQPVRQEPTPGMLMMPSGVGPDVGLPEADSSARLQPPGRQTPTANPKPDTTDAAGSSMVTPGRLAEAMMAEETQSDANAAARLYERIVGDFDQQRRAASQAVFRLAESYRRLGRLEEARALHGRILREFVDFPDLADLSLQALRTARQAPGGQGQYPGIPGMGGAPRPTTATDYLKEELKLLEEELKLKTSLYELGKLGREEILPLQRELFRLRERIAAGHFSTEHLGTSHPLRRRPQGGASYGAMSTADASAESKEASAPPPVDTAPPAAPSKDPLADRSRGPGAESAGPKPFDTAIVPTTDADRVPVHGRLVDKAGEPISNETIQLIGRRDGPRQIYRAKRTTAADGSFKFEDVPTDVSWSLEIPRDFGPEVNSSQPFKISGSGEPKLEVRLDGTSLQVTQQPSKAPLGGKARFVSWKAGTGTWNLANDVALEVKQDEVTGTKATTTAVLRWAPTPERQGLRHEISLGSRLWAMAWEYGVPVLWIAKGEPGSIMALNKDQLAASGIQWVDFSDPAAITQTSWSAGSGVKAVPDHIRAALENGIIIPKGFVEKNPNAPNAKKVLTIDRDEAKPDLSAISLTIDDSGVLLAGERITHERLKSVLDTASRAEGEQTVTVRAAPSVPYARVADVLGLCKEAGIRNVSFAVSAGKTASHAAAEAKSDALISADHAEAAGPKKPSTGESLATERESGNGPRTVVPPPVDVQ